MRSAGRCKVTVGEGDPVRPRACSQASPSSSGFVFPGSRGANVSTGEDRICRKRGLLFLCRASGRQLGAGQVPPQGETAGRSAWASLGSFSGEGFPVATSGSTLLFELKTSCRGGSHPCAEAPRTCYRQTFTHTRSVPGAGLRNDGGHRDGQSLAEGVAGCHHLRRGERDQRADKGQRHTKGTSVTFRSRVFGEEPGLSWASWKAGFHEAKGKDSKLKGQSGQRPKAGGCQAFPGRDRGARVSWKCWRKSWHRRGCRSPGFAHRPRSWYFWVWAALLCGQVAAEDGFSQEELGAGGLGGRFLQWLQSREGLARLDAMGREAVGAAGAPGSR